MAEKARKCCQGKDTFERMNFLYQAASAIYQKSPTLASYYGSQCKLISRKSLQRMEPDMKRTICKQCGLILMPGTSAELSIENKGKGDDDMCLIQCTKCDSVKRFRLSQKYNLWLDSDQCVDEKIQPNGG